LYSINHLAIFAAVALIPIAATGADGDPTRQAQNESQTASVLQLVDAELQLAEFRCEGIDTLLSEGHASVSDQQHFHEYRASLHNWRSAVAAASQNAPSEIVLMSDSDGRSQAVVTIPGMAAHPHLSPFATLRLPLDNDPSGNANALTVSIEPQQRALQAELNFRRELITRLQAISDGSLAAENEIRLHTLLEQRLVTAIKALSPVTVVAICPTPTDDERIAQPVSTHSRRDRPVMQAFAALEQQTALCQQKLQPLKLKLQEHHRRIAGLKPLAKEDQITARELQRERLLARLTKTEIAAVGSQLQSIAYQRDYLRTLTEPTSPGPDEFVTVNFRSDAQSRLILVAEAVVTLIDHYAHDTSGAELAEAQSDYLRWKFDGLQQLQATGHATWLEIQYASVALKKAKHDHQAATEKQRVAAAAVELLNP